MTDYLWVVTHLLTSLAAGLIGYFLGAMGVEIHQVKSEVHEVRATVHPKESPVPDRDVQYRNYLEKKLHRQAVLGVVLIAMAILSIVGSAISLQRDSEQTEAQQEVVECQSAFNAAFSESLAIRAQAASEDREVTETLVRGVARLIANPPESEAVAAAQYKKLFTAYVETVDANDKKRAANPLPDFSC